MDRTAVLALFVVVGAAMTACDQPKSASQVARDTAAAEHSAADSAARAQQGADARIASARADVGDEQRDLGHVDAVEGQKVAEAQAEGSYKVALAQCEGLSGATQQSCKDQAHADYDVAKATARQARVGADPKP